ncbi:MAG: radical SAM protein, partial [Xanthomonas perforans]|nr:radical SAM protein [Xanthomonas perforans]
TRRLIEVLWETRHPFTLITKNALVTRDLDLLAPLAREGLVNVHFSVTTLDPHLSARLEPRASAPHARLRAMRALHEAGVPVGVMAAPVIPWINDHELEAILQAAADAGASSAGYVLLRLPHEVAPLFR